MACFIWIKGGDGQLRKAVEVLNEGGVTNRAVGWGTDPAPQPRAQVQVEAADFERAKEFLSAAGVDFVPLPLKQSLLT